MSSPRLKAGWKLLSFLGFVAVASCSGKTANPSACANHDESWCGPGMFCEKGAGWSRCRAREDAGTKADSAVPPTLPDGAPADGFGTQSLPDVPIETPAPPDAAGGSPDVPAPDLSPLPDAGVCDPAQPPTCVGAALKRCSSNGSNFTMQPCDRGCAADACCPPGTEATNGACIPCGGEAQTCCQTAKPACASGSCASQKCCPTGKVFRDGQCRPDCKGQTWECGDQCIPRNQLCGGKCIADEACGSCHVCNGGLCGEAADGKVCGDGQRCKDGKCSACGANTQACCPPTNTCNSGHTCKGGKCEPECGGLRQKCCPGGPFGRGSCSNPDVLGCYNGTCEPCKTTGSHCCSDGGCRYQETCTLGMGATNTFCEACGHPGLECCLPSISLGGKECQVGTCQPNQDGIKMCVN